MIPVFREHGMDLEILCYVSHPVPRRSDMDILYLLYLEIIAHINSTTNISYLINAIGLISHTFSIYSMSTCVARSLCSSIDHLFPLAPEVLAKIEDSLPISQWGDYLRILLFHFFIYCKVELKSAEVTRKTPRHVAKSPTASSDRGSN